MEKTVSITCVAAIGLWVLTFVLIFSGTLVGLASSEDHLAVILALMSHGLACSAAAATVSIRMMFKNQTRLVQSAFDLARDAEGPVRRVR